MVVVLELSFRNDPCDVMVQADPDDVDLKDIYLYADIRLIVITNVEKPSSFYHFSAFPVTG